MPIMFNHLPDNAAQGGQTLNDFTPPATQKIRIAAHMPLSCGRSLSSGRFLRRAGWLGRFIDETRPRVARAVAYRPLLGARMAISLARMRRWR